MSPPHVPAAWIARLCGLILPVAGVAKAGALTCFPTPKPPYSDAGMHSPQRTCTLFSGGGIVIPPPVKPGRDERRFS